MQRKPAPAAAHTSAAGAGSVTGMRQNFSGTSPFEPIIGFSRAVRVGNAIHVSGTGPVGADEADAETQTRHTLEIIRSVLERAGARMEDVVRTRMYLTRVEDWEAVGRAHGEVFGSIRPAATMIVVAQLLNPAWRVEIEADAVVEA
ncbi:MAG TPA: RidA family protein [Granulicella sp.]